MLICLSIYLLCFNELVEIFKVNGIDIFICLLVNDFFVMEIWKVEQGVENIYFLFDGNGEFSEGMGMLVDKLEFGLGRWSWCYFMLVKDGLIEKMFIEQEGLGDFFEVLDVDIMLCYINLDVNLFLWILLFSKLGCLYCVCVCKLFKEWNYCFEEIELGSYGISYSLLQVVIGCGMMLQVYIDG